MENMKIVMESMDALVRVLSRCDIYEKLYCKKTPDPTQPIDIAQPLDDSMVDLYVSVLEYLCSARRYLGRNTAGCLSSRFCGVRLLIDCYTSPDTRKYFVGFKTTVGEDQKTRRGGDSGCWHSSPTRYCV